MSIDRVPFRSTADVPITIFTCKLVFKFFDLFIFIPVKFVVNKVGTYVGRFYLEGVLFRRNCVP